MSTTDTRTCPNPKCGVTIVDGGDFCPNCDTYLAWDAPAAATEAPAAPPTGGDPVPALAEAGAAEERSRPYSAAITVEQASQLVKPRAIDVGESYTLNVRVRNQSDAVDSFELRLVMTGAPDGHKQMVGSARVHAAFGNPLASLEVEGIRGDFPEQGSIAIHGIGECRYSALMLANDGTAGTFTIVSSSFSASPELGDLVSYDEFNLPPSRAGWWELHPLQAIDLLPFGTGRPTDCEGEARVVIHPPRAASTSAGLWKFELQVLRGEERIPVTAYQFMLEVGRFDELVLRPIVPERAHWRRRTFDIEITNTGNAPADVFVGGEAAKEGCRVLPAQPAENLPRVARMQLESGRDGRCTFVVAPVKYLIVGRAIEHRVAIRAARDVATLKLSKLPEFSWANLFKELVNPMAKKAARAEQKQFKQLAQLQTAAQSRAGPPAAAGVASAADTTGDAVSGKAWETTVTYRQTAIVPSWLLVLAAAVVILGVLLAILLKPTPKEKVVIPRFDDQYALAAQQSMDAAGLHAEILPYRPPWWRDRPAACRGSERVRPGQVIEAIEPRHGKFPKPTPRPGRLPAGKLVTSGKRIDKGDDLYLITAVRPESHAPGRQTVLPNVSDLDFAGAQAALSCAGFSLYRVTPNPVPKGMVVVSQTPSPSPRVLAPVRARVTLGFDEVAAVPNLAGLSSMKARNKVIAVNLIMQVPANQPNIANVVAGQAPPPGSLVEVGNSVTVTLGVKVPSLLRFSLPAATALLHEEQLARGPVPASPPADAAVTSQSPRGGEPVKLGTTVTLSLGVPVPSVQHLNLAAAQARLGTQQLLSGSLTPSSPPADALVTSQQPRAGAVVALGTHVSLRLTAPKPKKSSSKAKPARNKAASK